MAHSSFTTQIGRRPPAATSEGSNYDRSPVADVAQRPILDDYLRYFRSELSPESAPASLPRTRRILDRIADIVNADGSGITERDCAHLLKHLVATYAESEIGREDKAFTATALGYARVVKALGRRCPACDFREAIGQLLGLMTRLFETGHPSWKGVFRLLRAVPESVKGRQRLQGICSMHVREWFEAGVPNLLTHQKELQHDIEELNLEIDTLQREIRTFEAELESKMAPRRASFDPQIAILAAERKQRQIVYSKRKMRLTLAKRDGKALAASLIESDIRSLGGRLRTAGRTYRLRLV